MRPLALFACCLFVLACSDDLDNLPLYVDAATDGGSGGTSPDASSMNPDASRGDGGSTPDAGGQVGKDAGVRPDGAPNSGCTQIELDDFQLSLEDDVSVRYAAEVTPRIEKTLSLLEILFERYVPGPDTGTFELGGDGPDGNYGGCAHCVAIPGIAPEYAYFADRGTLVVETDPYKRRLKVKIQDLRLVEVTVSLETRASAPVRGGKCIEVGDLEIDAIFPREGWTCDEEKFADGESCDCECGSSDPDCDIFICAPEDTSCPEPLPVADCGANAVCRFGVATLTTRCYETCTWGETPCASGACLFDYGLYTDEVCASGEDEVSSAKVGEECGERAFTRPCHVVDGFAQGHCDFDGRCRPVCETDTDCAGQTGTTCQSFYVDRKFGYCALPMSSE